ncbi:capsule biosynthesis GfcC family protein [Paraglaciecola aestuariivivens]
MQQPFVLFLSFMALLSSYCTQAEVTISFQQQDYQFKHQPYLTEVLAPLAQKQAWYWPSAALYKNSDEGLNHTKVQVLTTLKLLLNQYQKKQPELAQSIQALITEIQSWRLAYRLPTQIDYDLTRLQPSKNPRLTPGHYILYLSERKPSVEVFGAIQQSKTLTHHNHSDINRYLKQINLSNLADQDYVILLQADGRQLKVPVAYWNKIYQEAMPGSQIFVPFKARFFQAEFDTLNQQIVQLAANRLAK